MSDQFIAEIRIFAGNFAPYGWAFCNGQIMAISQNAALFSLLGNTYGGNGTTNFSLPNLQGLAPLAAGQGTGLSNRQLGETGGEPTVTLLSTELATHSHAALADTNGGVNTPAGNAWGEVKVGRTATSLYAASGANNVTMSSQILPLTGGNLPHNNLQPYLCLNFIIALQGIFPPRS